MYVCMYVRMYVYVNVLESTFHTDRQKSLYLPEYLYLYTRLSLSEQIHL